MVQFERALVGSYRPSTVTFPLSLCVSQILPLLCSIRPFFPTPPLVSPKFPHVSLEVGGWLFGYEERRCWANCPCNQFPRFPTYVITIHQRHRRTDGRADRQTDTTRPQYRAMHCSASRGKNKMVGRENCNRITHSFIISLIITH